MVAGGYVPGVKFVNKFGYNPDIGTADVPEEIWGSGGIYTGFPATADIVEVFSSDANDDAGDTGARNVRLQGLKTDESTEYEFEDIEMNGLTAVDSVNSWYRLNRFFIVPEPGGDGAGSSGTNEGTITVRQKNTTSNIMFALPPNFGQSILACWSVPFDNDFYIDHIFCRMARSGNGAGSALVALQTREWGSNAWRSREVYSITNSEGVEENFNFPIPIRGATDVRMRVLSVSANGTRISGGFNGMYGRSKAMRNMFLQRPGLDRDDY